MKKIPTLFERQFEGHRIVGIADKVTPGMEWVLTGDGDATVKWDGSACAIIDGKFYKRYDAKNGKPVPNGAIKCQDEPDPITGHLPCWVECDRGNPGDRWFWAAYDNSVFGAAQDGTFEAIGKHFQSNPYGLDDDKLVRHGANILTLPNRSFDAIRAFLQDADIEGIVFWQDGEPRCKIKRTDFGFSWPVKEAR